MSKNLKGFSLMPTLNFEFEESKGGKEITKIVYNFRNLPLDLKYSSFKSVKVVQNIKNGFLDLNCFLLDPVNKEKEDLIKKYIISYISNLASPLSELFSYCNSLIKLERQGLEFVKLIKNVKGNINIECKLKNNTFSHSLRHFIEYDVENEILFFNYFSVMLDTDPPNKQFLKFTIKNEKLSKGIFFPLDKMPSKIRLKILLNKCI